MLSNEPASALWRGKPRESKVIRERGALAAGGLPRVRFGAKAVEGANQGASSLVKVNTQSKLWPTRRETESKRVESARLAKLCTPSASPVLRFAKRPNEPGGILGDV